MLFITNPSSTDLIETMSVFFIRLSMEVETIVDRTLEWFVQLGIIRSDVIINKKLTSETEGTRAAELLDGAPTLTAGTSAVCLGGDISS